MAIKIVTKIDKVISLPREEMHQTMENRPGYLGVHGDKRNGQGFLRLSILH
ncbi:MAG: hypothetical protein J1D85_04550 [Bacteroidales bacterium]|nr:hypothetical protein [Bacteroidales bacterium]